MDKVPDILPHALYGNICFLSYIKLNLFIHTLPCIHLKLFRSIFNEYFSEYFLDQWVFLSSWLQVIGNQNASCADSFLLDTSLTTRYCFSLQMEVAVYENIKTEISKGLQKILKGKDASQYFKARL